MDTCVICLELMNVKPSYKLPCLHEFHTECQIEWFRGGNANCPTCRSNENTIGIRHHKNQTAFQIMCQRARKNDAPTVLKRAYEKYKKTKLREREITKEITECRQKVGKFSDIYKEYNALRRKRWNALRTAHTLHREISSLCEILTVIR